MFKMELKRQKEEERVEERARVQYLHSLRLVHGFDCILCHSSGGKRDKRTSCREGRRGGRDGGTVEGRRGRAEGQEEEEEEEEEGRQERTKTRQKGWTRRCYKKTQTEIDTENSSQADNSVLSRCGNNSRKTSTVSWQPHPPPDPVPPPRPIHSHHRTSETTTITIGALDWLLMPSPPPSSSSSLSVTVSSSRSYTLTELVIPEFSRSFLSTIQQCKSVQICMKAIWIHLGLYCVSDWVPSFSLCQTGKRCGGGGAGRAGTKYLQGLKKTGIR